MKHCVVPFFFSTALYWQFCHQGATYAFHALFFFFFTEGFATASNKLRHCFNNIARHFATACEYILQLWLQFTCIQPIGGQSVDYPVNRMSSPRIGLLFAQCALCQPKCHLISSVLFASHYMHHDSEAINGLPLIQISFITHRSFISASVASVSLKYRAVAYPSEERKLHSDRFHPTLSAIPAGRS
jgi:hypothetical protein